MRGGKNVFQQKTMPCLEGTSPGHVLVPFIIEHCLHTAHSAKSSDLSPFVVFFFNFIN